MVDLNTLVPPARLFTLRCPEPSTILARLQVPVWMRTETSVTEGHWLLMQHTATLNCGEARY